MKIACVIPTCNGGADIRRLIDSLASQSAIFDIFVVDSSSVDGSLDFLDKKKISIFVIDSSDFNHGGTRQMMVNQNPLYDIYVFLTQDVCFDDNDSIANIVAPFLDERIGAVCGRQLPHHDANIYASHARFFNYPGQSACRSIDDVSKFGIKTAFLSNSFAAYRASALSSVGGFPSNVILSEDMWVGAKMLLNGWSIFYAANAICNHSHNYTVVQEFKRYFDIGVFHAREAWIKKSFGGAGGEGFRFILSELSFLGWNRCYLYPESLVRNFSKLLGYKLGCFERFLPQFCCRIFSMHRKFWN